MQLLNPLMLMGAMGALLPILIHLIQKQRAPEHVFPPARLLMDSRREVKRRIRMRHWLVMLLRALFVVLLAIALAQPVLERTQSFGLPRQPTACVLVVDDSLSMQYKPNGRANSDFERVQQRGIAILQSLREFDESAVVTFSGRNVGSKSLDNNHGSRIKDFRDLVPTYGNDRAENAVRRAREKISASDVENKKLVILSDFSRSGWSKTSYDLLAGASCQVSIPAVVDSSETRSNRFFRNADISSTNDSIAARTDVETVGPVDQNSDEVSLFVRGQLRDSKPIQGENARVKLRTHNDHRRYYGRIELPPDPLKPDNNFYYVGRSEADVNVVLVEGNPRENMYNNETYHIDLALTGEGSNIRTNIVTPPGLREVDLARYDCVVFGNVRRIDKATEQRMREYLQDGGRVWFVLGDQTETASVNRLKDLTSVDIKRVHDGTESRNAHIDAEDLNHTIFEGFSSRWLEQFTAVQFNQWWLLDVMEEGDTIMTLENGDPLLVRSAVEGGEVYVLASSLNRQWNDFPLRSVFVPFVQRLVRYMGGSLTQSKNQQLWVGETYQMELPETIKQAYIKAPDSDRYRAVESHKASDGHVLKYDTTDQPGQYIVTRTPEGNDVLSRFAVNVRPEASDVRPLPDERQHHRRVSTTGSSTQESSQGANGIRVYHLVLWACLCLLCAESIASR